MTDQLNGAYDVVVVGGGAAGLNAALMLARVRRPVAVIDAGEPRNAPAEGVHGLLARDGVPPAELLRRGREEVRNYGGEVVFGEVIDVFRGDDGFAVTLADGRTVNARRLLVTTGLTDELPDVPGLGERWGRDVVHCPYCHGWEVRDRAIGVLASGPMSVHQALLFSRLSEDVVFFTHTASLSDEETEQLAATGVRVVHGEVAAVEIGDEGITGVRLADGTVISRQAVAVATRMVARAGFLGRLGLKPAEHPMGEYIPSDDAGRTDVSGVWVAGNVTDLAAQVGGAAAAGAAAAGQINADLIAEDTTRAVEAYRERGRTVAHGSGADTHHEFTEAYWEEQYRAHGGGSHSQLNPVLVAEIADLEPGTALDAGCGEGAGAVWLASHGWHVTAVDISPTALGRARERAALAGPDVAKRIEWVQADLTTWRAEPAAFDLVSALYVHTTEPLATQVDGLAAAVAPGGTLLIVGHGPSDPNDASPPHARFTAEQIAGTLDPDVWDVAVAEVRTRTAEGQHGQVATLHDAVLRARKHS